MNYSVVNTAFIVIVGSSVPNLFVVAFFLFEGKMAKACFVIEGTLVIFYDLKT